MPDEFDAPVEQATAAPGEKRSTSPHYCPTCGAVRNNVTPLYAVPGCDCDFCKAAQP